MTAILADVSVGGCERRYFCGLRCLLSFLPAASIACFKFWSKVYECAEEELSLPPSLFADLIQYRISRGSRSVATKPVLFIRTYQDPGSRGNGSVS